MRWVIHGPVLAWIVAMQASAAAPVAAQGPPQSLRLAALQREALAADPRLREVELQDLQTGLRLRNIEVERLPAVSALGLTQIQSDVPTAPVTLPGGQPFFAPPKDTYDVSVRVDQRLFDAAIGPRLALTRADLAESQARLRTTLFSLRHEVNDAFFTAALVQGQIAALGVTITDLETRLRETNARVREGTALAGDAAAIEATLLQYRQQDDELRANRGAALARLARLTRRAIDADSVIELPDLEEPVAQARNGLDRLRARPEYAQFERARDRAARQQDLTAAQERPQLSAFGRVGYGQPGLNFIDDRFEAYALGGVQLQWKAWTWGSSSRERQALALQQSIVAAEEDAFTDGLRRSIETDLATIDRLQRALMVDERIVTLRESVDRTTRRRFQEGVVTASDYLDRNTEWLHAQLDRTRHGVELAQARARLLTTLGLEVR